MQKLANELFTTDSTIKTISKKELDYAFNVLENFEKEHADEFKSIVVKYIKAFNAENSDGSINRIPYKSFSGRIIDAVNKPFRNLYRQISNNSEEFEKQKIKNEFSNFEGYIDSIKAWKAGNKDGYVNGISDKLNLREFKFIKPDKAHYSNVSLSVGNRVVSGTLAGLYLANDAYNTTRVYNDDKKKSKKEANIRLKQEYARIGVNAALSYVVLDACKKFVNRKLSNAILVSLATAFVTEIVGRKLVGKHILPQSYEKLKELEDNRELQKQSILASKSGLSQGKRYSEIYSEQLHNNPAFASFTGNNIAFTGSKLVSAKKILNVVGDAFDKEFAKAHHFDKKEIIECLDILGKAYPQTQKRYIKIIEKGFAQQEGLKGKTFDEVINDKLITQIPVGSKTGPFLRTGAAAFAPISLIGKVLDNLVSKAHYLVKGKTLTRLKNAEYKLSKVGLTKEFNKAVKDENIADKKKLLEIAESILEKDKTNKKELNGVKNAIELVSKIKKTSRDEDVIKNVKSKIGKAVRLALGSKGSNYDAADFTLLNRVILAVNTAFFLGVDAYNLGNLYSKGNKVEARQKAKERTAQTAAKVALSAYMINLTVKMFHGIYNRSLPCALAVTALNVGIYETLSRTVTGFPIFRKNKKQLEELQAKNEHSKNPIVRFLVNTIGKNKFKNVSDIQKPVKNINFKSSRSNASNSTAFVQKFIDSRKLNA